MYFCEKFNFSILFLASQGKLLYTIKQITVDDISNLLELLTITQFFT